MAGIEGATSVDALLGSTTDGGIGRKRDTQLDESEMTAPRHHHSQQQQIEVVCRIHNNAPRLHPDER